MMLDHAESVLQRDPAGQVALERPKGRAVVAAHKQQVFATAALGLRREAQLGAVIAGDRAQVSREAHWWRLVGHAPDPHGPLAATRRVVDPLHQVERERHTVRPEADTGGPPPPRPAPGV